MPVSLVPSDNYVVGIMGIMGTMGIRSCVIRVDVIVSVISPCRFLKQVDYFSLVDEIKEDSC